MASDRDDYVPVLIPKEPEEPPEVLCVLTTQCFECQYTGEHRNPPAWHTWADDADIAHAAATGQPDPTASRCGCPCAVVRTEEARDGE